MTQDKMRRIITACVSAATVLLVFLLGFLIYQWVTIGVRNKKIETLEAEIAVLERQIAENSDEMSFLEGEGLRLQLSKLMQEKEILEDK